MQFSETPVEGLSEFQPGQPWPPRRESARIALQDKYAAWRAGQRLTDTVGNATDARRLEFYSDGRASPRLAPNLFRFVAEFWSQAITSSGPTITAEGRAQELIDGLLPSLLRATSELTGDLVAFGAGALWCKAPGLVEAIEPRHLFPIVPEAWEPPTGWVIARPWRTGTSGAVNRVTLTLVGEPNVTRVLAVDGGVLGRVIARRESPGAPGALTVLHIGQGDYSLIEQYVGELLRRETSISLALDDHAAPHFAIPDTMVPMASRIKDDGAGWFADKAEGFAGGAILPVPQGTFVPQYVTWNAEFAAQESAISRAEDRILRLCKIAPVLATPGKFGISSIPSGAALRRLAVMTVNRLRELRAELSAAYRRVVAGQVGLLAAAGGERLTLSGPVTVTWPTELGTGLSDEADSLAALVGSGILSAAQARAKEEGSTGDA